MERFCAPFESERNSRILDLDDDIGLPQKSLRNHFVEFG